MSSGREKGSLAVVGIGPGAADMMTGEAFSTIEESDVIAGYQVYVDLVKEQFPGKEFLATPMRREEERCALALREAAEGKKVALICSGDAGVYGLAGLVLEMAAEFLQPIEDAGIKLVMTVGNHDLREPFLRHLGRWTGVSPVPGRIVSVTHLPDFDFILLDSLKEPKPEDRGKYKALEGCGLGDAQLKWLEETLAASTRPTIVAAHHTAWSLGIKKLLRKVPTVFGYIHGHNHKWDVGYLFDYGRIPLVRSQGIASLALDRDIGYAYLRSLPDRAELKFVARDYFFPRQLAANEERPPLWDDIVRDNTGRRVSFPFRK